MNSLPDNKLDFWISVVEKLNMGSDLHEPLLEVLEELCSFFKFGCAFLYKTDQKGIFVLKEFFSAYDGDHLSETLDLKNNLGEGFFAELTTKTHIVYNKKQSTLDSETLEKKLGAVFNANILTLIPVIDQENNVAALVGFIDRRNKNSFEKTDLALSNAVLGAIANRVKLQVFEERLLGAQSALKNVLDNMGFDVYVNDFYTHEILYVNKSMAKLYGGPGNMIGKKCFRAIYTDQFSQCSYCPQKKLIDENGNPTKVYSWDYQRPFDGAWFRVISAAFPWANGRLAQVVSSIDISESKKNEETIKSLAEKDDLTNLPNRRKMVQELSRLKQEIKYGLISSFYIFFFDLNGFKIINDIYGHTEGDKLLKNVSKTLKNHMLTKDKAYRYGGDEFVIITPEPSTEELLGIIKLLSSDLVGDNVVGVNSGICTASIGIAQYPNDGADIEDIIHSADIAMYKSKENIGERVHFYHRGNISTPEEYFKYKNNLK